MSRWRHLLVMSGRREGIDSIELTLQYPVIGRIGFSVFCTRCTHVLGERATKRNGWKRGGVWGREGAESKVKYNVGIPVDVWH